MRRFGIILLAIWLPGAACAAQAGYCARAALKAGAENGVPREILMEVAGGDGHPAPWSVAVAGRTEAFDDRDAALSEAYHVFRQGDAPFALGCFRVDFDLHGRHFASLDEMFDPLANARYAARFLSLLHGAFGDWDRAVAAYRDRSGDYALAYDRQLDAFRDPTARAPRAGASGIGSLVPLGAPAAPSKDR